MRPPPLIPISYLNDSDETIPAFAVVKLQGPCDEVVGTKVVSVKAVKPDGSGVHAIDLGGGAANPLGTGSGAGDAAYGQCVMPMSHTIWVLFEGDLPATPWESQVGPTADSWAMSTAGSGYWYAGLYDASRSLILVTQIGGGGEPIVGFEITDADCASGTALADVISVTDGSGSPAIGEEIQVCDTIGAFLIGSDVVMNGRKGFAQRQRGISCTEQASGTGTGTGTAQIENPYAIISLGFADVTCVGG